VIVPKLFLFLVLFRPGTMSVRSGLGTFFVPEPEHAIRRTESWCVAQPNTCSLHPTGRASGDRPSIHATANDHGLPRTGHGYGSAAVLATHEAIPPPLPSSLAWTGKMLSGQSTDQTMRGCDTELKLACCNVLCICWTARRRTLTLSIV